jgi:hypothetical protein
MKVSEYDGIFFLPTGDSDELSFNYFKFQDEFIAEPIESTPVGHKYHVAFFKPDEEGNPMFDEQFEAIFADPAVYLRGLAGMDLFGCIAKKTEKSAKWWESYLTTAKNACKMASQT